LERQEALGERIRESFISGIERIKWLSGLVSERVKAEIALIRLAGEIEKFKEKKRHSAEKIGLRVFELKGAEGIDIYNDPIIKDALKEIDSLEEESEKLRDRLSEISRSGVE